MMTVPAVIFRTAKRFGLLAASAATLCVSIPALAEPQISAEAAVKNCRYLADVEGKSGYGKNINWQALAKRSVLAQADKMAATHLVRVRFYPLSGFNGIAAGKAYRCD